LKSLQVRPNELKTIEIAIGAAVMVLSTVSCGFSPPTAEPAPTAQFSCPSPSQGPRPPISRLDKNIGSAGDMSIETTYRAVFD